MQKKILFALVLAIFATNVSAQTDIYIQNFDGVAPPDLPADWSATSSQIFTNASSASSGYSGASGGNNLLSRNCNPNGEARSFQVDGISTTNAEDLTVSFGHRRTNAFTPAVALEWSSDGTNWNTIAYNSGAATTTWALFSSAPLPAGAEAQPNLRFRWSYTTSFTGSVPCDNFAGNYRIDDFIVTAQTILPIELVQFTAAAKGRSILLFWRTATEISNSHFAVERSPDGRNFTAIGQVPGAGTSFEPQHYIFTDERPLPGLNYYRLRQVDFDGQFSYSPVVTALVGQPGGILLFPSPATDFLNIQLEKPLEETVVWEVFDLTGRLLRSGKFLAETADVEINVNELPRGIYALRVVAGREAFVKQFQKQ